MSLLPHVSKVFERIIINKLIFTCKITGFRKSHEAQHSLMEKKKKWKSVLDKGKNICVLFMDISKPFETINHDLLPAKLKAHGFSINTLDLMCSYLRKQGRYMLAFPRVPLMKLF